MIYNVIHIKEFTHKAIQKFYPSHTSNISAINLNLKKLYNKMYQKANELQEDVS